MRAQKELRYERKLLFSLSLLDALLGSCREQTARRRRQRAESDHKAGVWNDGSAYLIVRESKGVAVIKGV